MKTKSKLSKRNISKQPSKRKHKKGKSPAIKNTKLIKEQNELLREMKTILEENRQDRMDPSEFSKMISEQEKVMKNLQKIQSKSFSNYYLDGFHKAYNTYPNNDKKDDDTNYTVVLPFGQSITVKAKGKKNNTTEPTIKKRSTSKTKHNKNKSSSKKKVLKNL